MQDAEGVDGDGQVGNKSVQLHDNLESKQHPVCLVALLLTGAAAPPFTATSLRTVDEQDCPVVHLPCILCIWAAVDPPCGNCMFKVSMLSFCLPPGCRP